MSLNDLLAAVDEDATASLRKTANLSVNFADTFKVNPDDEAEKLKLQDDTGVPASLMDETVRQDAELQRYLARPELADLPSHPVTSDWYAKRENAGIAHDDVAALTSIEKQIAEFSKVRKGEQSTLKGDSQGVRLGWGDALGYVSRQFESGQESQTLGKVARERRQAGLEVSALEQGLAQRTEAAQKEREGDVAVGKIVGGALNFAGQMWETIKGASEEAAAGLVVGATAGAIGGPLAPLTATAGGLAGMGAGLVYGFAKEMQQSEYGHMVRNLEAVRGANGETLPPDMVDELSLVYSLGSAAIETASFGVLAAPFKRIVREKLQGAIVKQLTARAALWSFVKSHQLAAVAESSEEVAQTVLESTLTNLAKSSAVGEFTEESAGEIAEKAGQAFVDTYLAMLIPAGVGPGANIKTDIRNARRAQENKAFLEALGNGVEAAKTGQRLPDKLQKLVADIKAHYGEVDNVYMDAERFQTFFQERGIDPDELAATLAIPDYAEQVATGGPIAIPLESYARHLAATDFRTDLAQEVKFDPEEMTPREQAEFQATRVERYASMLDEVETSTVEETGAASLGKIERAIYDELVGAGREKTLAKAEAQTWRDRYRARASRLGVDPWELYQGNPVSVGTVLPEVMRRDINLDVDPLLDRLRVGDIPTEKQAFGESLGDFLRMRGLKDDGGELASLGVDQGLKPFQRKMAQPDGLVFDEAVTVAVENGYLKEGATVADLLDAIDRDARGNAVYAPQNEDAALSSLRMDLEQMRAFLESRGVDLQTADNAAVKAALDAAMEEEVLFQDKTDPRAAITFRTSGEMRKVNITLLKGANWSSFLHESGHAWLEELREDAQAGGNQQIIDDWNTIAKKIGVDPLTESIGVDGHEQFARMTEAYFWEGKSPSVELMQVMQRFALWLKRLYRSLTSLDVDLTDEVRGVFDRLLATDEQIKSMRELQRLSPLMTDAATFGMSETEFAAYQELVAKAGSEQADALLHKAMKEVTREHEAWWKEEKARIRAEVEAEAKANKVYQVIHALTTGEDFEGNKTPEGFKLSKDILVDLYGAETVRKMPRSFRYTYTQHGGLDPDVVAEQFGFTSGREMVEAMVNTPPMQQAVSAETDARMKLAHGDMRSDGSFAGEALKALHDSEFQEKVLEAEVKALRKKRREVLPFVRAAVRAENEGRRQLDDIPPLAVFRAMAKESMSRKPIRGIRPETYAAAERKAGREAIDAAAKNDWQKAAEQKQKQLLNYYLFREAIKAREEADTIRAFMRKMEQPRAQGILGKAGLEYQKAVNDLLEQYEFKRVTNKELDYRASLDALAKKLVENGRDASVIESLVLSLKQNYRELPLEDLRAVHDMARFIYHQAKTAESFRNGEKVFAKELIRREVITSIIENAKNIDAGMGNDSGFKALKKNVGNFISNSYTADTILFGLDGWERMGASYRHIKGVIDDAVARDLLPAQDKMAQDIEALFSVYTGAELKKMTRKDLKIPELDRNRSFSKEELIELACGQGNAGNKEALLSSRIAKRNGLTQERVDSVLDRYLDERDWNFVQAKLDYLETYWPQIAEKQRQRKGIIPPKVEATPIQTRFGTLRGGYYPLKFDGGKSINAAQDSAEEFFTSVRNGRFSWAQTAHGHTIERVGSGGRAVLLSPSVFFSHLNQVIVDLTMGDAVNYSASVLNDAQIKAAFEDANAVDARRYLDVWLTDVAMGEKVATDGISRTFRHLRTGIAARSMLFNVGVALTQLTGLGQTAVVIGKANTLYGVQQVLGRKWFGPNSVGAQINQMSPFMAKRDATWNKDAMDFVNSFKRSAVRNFISDYGMLLIAKGQHVVDMATWLGAYRQYQQEHPGTRDGDADAIAYADRMISRSQGSGIFSERSALERGSLDQTVRQNEMVRSLTTLLSYQIAKFNVATERVGRTNLRDPKEVIGLAGDMVLLYFLDTVMVMLMAGIWPGEDDDESWMWKVFKKTGSSAISAVPMARDVVSLLEGFPGGGTMGAFAQSVKRVIDQASQGDIDAALLRAVNNLSGMLLRYPSGAINRFASALHRDLDGEDVALIEYFVYQENRR